MKWRILTLLWLVLTTPPATAQPQLVEDPYFRSQGSWSQGFADQWALQQLRINPSPIDGAASVIVAVIDSGLDYLHPDFDSAQLWRNPRETANGIDDDGNGYIDDLIGWNFVANDNNPWDDSGHGTHISGVIAASTFNGRGIAAINPHARIMPLKVSNFAGNARGPAVAAAIYYATDQGARIINLSLAGFQISAAERAAVDYAHRRGVLVVAAVGNRATGADDFGFASLPGVLSVVATDRNRQRTLFSNFGADVDLAAPGVDILSLRARDTDFILLTQPANYQPGAAIVGADRAYYRASGTSFACAIVSAVASRLLSSQPQLSVAQLERKLLQSAQDLEVPGVDQITGYGLLDPAAALGWPVERYVEARIRAVEVGFDSRQIPVLRVMGDADADNLSTAVLQIAAEDSSDWHPAAEPLRRGVHNDTLAEIDLNELLRKFPGQNKWRLRLVCETADGRRREAGFVFSLPIPPSGQNSAAGES